MANCAPGSVDIVIVDSTDPVGPAEGLFNKAFYDSCFRALKDDGILVQQSESPLVLLDLIKAMRARNAQGRLHRVQDPAVPAAVLPDRMVDLHAGAGSRGGFEFREDDARATAFDSKYYSADIHRGALAPPPFVAAALGD